MNPRENTLQRSLTTLTTTWLSWNYTQRALASNDSSQAQSGFDFQHRTKLGGPAFIPEAPKYFIE
jgi:hypothetical protein